MYNRFTMGDPPPDWNLTTYGPNEGPAYPRANKKGDVGGFFRALQRKELQACTKGIFADVKIKYDPHAENIARFKREYSRKVPARIISEKEYEAAIAPKRRAARWNAVRRARTSRILDSIMA